MDTADGAEAIVIGGPRLEPVAWIGLGILGLVMVVMTGVLWGFAGQGPWPVPIVWSVGALVAARLLTARELCLTAGGIAVTRHLLGWSWTRHHPLRHLAAVRVTCAFLPPRHNFGDGTPEGEVPLLMFTTRLRGRPRLTLGFARDVDAMEGLALRVARLLGVSAERHGYTRRARDGLPVRGQGTSPLIP